MASTTSGTTIGNSDSGATATNTNIGGAVATISSGPYGSVNVNLAAPVAGALGVTVTEFDIFSADVHVAGTGIGFSISYDPQTSSVSISGTVGVVANIDGTLSINTVTGSTSGSWNGYLSGATGIGVGGIGLGAGTGVNITYDEGQLTAGAHIDMVTMGVEGILTIYTVPGRAPPTVDYDTVGPQCFPAGTPITLPSGTTVPIETLLPQNSVAGFAEHGERLRNGTCLSPVTSLLRGGVVKRLYHNVTDEWVTLAISDPDSGEVSYLTSTPGHVMLTPSGEYRQLGEMIDGAVVPIKSAAIKGVAGAEHYRPLGRVELVLTDGRIAAAEAHSIKYSTATAHLFEQAEMLVTRTEHGLALEPEMRTGWKTYNFEVEEFHTYVAGGVRVHNTSEFSLGTVTNGYFAGWGVAGTSAVWDGTAAAAPGQTAYARSLSHPGTVVSRDPDTGWVSVNNTQTGVMTVTTNTGLQAIDYSASRGLSGSGFLGSISGAISSLGDAFSGWGGWSGAWGGWGSSSSSSIDGGYEAGNLSSEPSGGTSGGFNPTDEENDGGIDVGPGTGGPEGGTTEEGETDPEEGDGDGGGPKPIVMDLDGDGYAFTSPEDDDAILFDFNADGYARKMAWPEAGDGFLVFDANGNGLADDGTEIGFTGYKEGARTDLEGLTAFNTNGDGVLSALDDDWAKFGVWQDVNQNGKTDPGEFKTLDEMGIVGINLTSNMTTSSLGSGATSYGIGTFTYADGSTGTFADAALAESNTGIAIDGDGVHVISDLGMDGYFATNAAGVTRTFDHSTIVRGSSGDDSFDASWVFGTMIMDGREGNDTLIGGFGDDIIIGGEGDDVVDAGFGDDLISAVKAQTRLTAATALIRFLIHMLTQARRLTWRPEPVRPVQAKSTHSPTLKTLSGLNRPTV